MADVVLRSVRKVYDNGHVAVAGADFTIGDGELLDSTLLHEDIRRVAPDDPHFTEGLEAVLARTERETIRAALERVDGSVETAAQLLKVSRSTLYRRIQALGLA